VGGARRQPGPLEGRAGADETVARRAGELAREHRRRHAGIDTADYLIAATAQLLDAELLTTNLRCFPMLPGLRAAY
jgi:hypothetical protein